MLKISEKDVGQQVKVKISLSVILIAKPHRNQFTNRFFNVENGGIHIGAFLINYKPFYYIQNI